MLVEGPYIFVNWYKLSMEILKCPNFPGVTKFYLDQIRLSIDGAADQMLVCGPLTDMRVCRVSAQYNLYTSHSHRFLGIWYLD